LTWPNSSDSINSAEIAAQLTGTNEPLARLLMVQGAGGDLLAGAGFAR
jgi:hypothetical protein